MRLKKKQDSIRIYNRIVKPSVENVCRVWFKIFYKITKW